MNLHRNPTRTWSTLLLSPAHAPAIQRMASDRAIAATTRVPHPYPPQAAAEFVEQTIRDRASGSGYGFAILDRDELVGICGVRDLRDRVEGEVGYWIGRPYWGRGYATFGVGMLLEFCFRNLGLALVHARALETNAASRRVLEKLGFALRGYAAHAEPQWKASERLAVYSLTEPAWRRQRDAPALAALHPALRGLLEAELAAGNRIRETGRGWPDGDSVFVRMEEAFRVRAAAMPEGVRYTELNDPHWWRAEYSTERPRHILAW